LTQNGEQARLPDTAAILNSVGEAAYEWRLDTDVLSWSANASDVLGVELGEVTSGRAFALHVEAEPGQNRAEALQGATQIDTGQGVPYLIEYGFKSAAGLRAATAGRFARMASCAASTSGTRVKSS
jgi:PAS domain-containing protein